MGLEKFKIPIYIDIDLKSRLRVSIKTNKTTIIENPE